MLVCPCNLIRIQFALSPFLQAALFLLFPLFKADLTAMTSILLADRAVSVLALPTCTPETCPGVPLTLKLAPQIQLTAQCWGSSANTLQPGFPGWERQEQPGDRTWLSFDTCSSYAWSKIIRHGYPLSEVTAGLQGFEGQGAGTGCDSRRRDLWRHFREDIFMEPLTGRAQHHCHPTGTPAQLSHPGMAQGTSPTPSLPHLLPG